MRERTDEMTSRVRPVRAAPIAGLLAALRGGGALAAPEPAPPPAVALAPPETDCPSASDVGQALAARARAPARAGPPYRLRLREGATAGAVVLELAAPDGELVLARSLARPAHAPGGCRTLADTIALIVLRRVREIAFRGAPAVAPTPRDAGTGAEADAAAVAPGPPPEAPGAALLLGGGLATRVALGPAARTMRAEAQLAAGVELGRLGLSVGFGFSTADGRAVDGAGTRFTVRAYPLRAALALRLALGPGLLSPSLGGALDLLRAEVIGNGAATRRTVVEPAAEVGLGYRLATRGLYVLLEAHGGRTLPPRDFDVGGARPTFRTPAGYFRAGLGIGVVLGKNERPRGL
jgi:hypothetical protein